MNALTHGRLRVDAPVRARANVICSLDGSADAHTKSNSNTDDEQCQHDLRNQLAPTTHCSPFLPNGIEDLDALVLPSLLFLSLVLLLQRLLARPHGAFLVVVDGETFGEGIFIV